MSRLSLIMDQMAEQIRDFYADADDPIAIQVEGRMVVSPSDPCIDILPAPTARDNTSAGMNEISGGYLLTVRARAKTPDNVAAQDLLLAFMDDEDDLCLAQALYEDPTLNGLACDVDVRDNTGFLAYPELEGGWIGTQWTVLVLNATS